LPSSVIHNRRLTDRILANWIGITEEKRLPRPAEITRGVFGSDWSRCALIKLDPVPAKSRLVYLGEDVPSTQEAMTEPEILADMVEDALLRRVAEKIPAVISKPGPITLGGACVIGAEIRLYRSILLPVSEDGVIIDHVLVAISYRDVPLEESSLDSPTGFDLSDPANVMRALMGHRLFPLM
jgi:hypothetical protein